MIDLHCHLLPGVDDGAKDMDQALALFKCAFEDGIRHVCLTPHMHTGCYDNTPDKLEPVFERLKQALTDHCIDISLRLAGEVRLDADVIQRYQNQQLPYIGSWQGKQVLLLELPHSGIPLGSEKLVDWLLERNILPMIAHPERNKAMAEDYDKIQPFIARGCLLQLTAMSITGQFGHQATECAHYLIREGLATIVASDAHNLNHRPPVLSEAYAFVTHHFNKDTAQQIFITQPSKISGLM